MKHEYVLPIFLFVFVSFLFESVTSWAEPSNSVKIGLVTDLSGSGAYYGKQTLLGAQIAASELEAAGQKVSLVVGDHQFKTAAAVSEAQKMIAFDNVDAFYTEYTSCSVAMSPIIADARKIMVQSSTGTSILSSNPYSFK